MNLFLYDPGVEDPAGIITDGHANATGRKIKIPPGTMPDEGALREMVRAIAGRNRAGGWRRL